MPFNDSTNLNHISKYIVDFSGATPYSTIQSAIDAATAAGVRAAVYIRSGTYNENLLLSNGIALVGDVEEGATIVGVHTPPPTGELEIKNVKLSGTSNLLSSAVAGTTNITLKNCIFDLSGGGFVLDLLNWTGTLTIEECDDISTVSRVVNNASTANINFFRNTKLGAGIAPMNLAGSGLVAAFNTIFLCPINIAGTTTFSAAAACGFGSNVTYGVGTTGEIVNCTIGTGIVQALTVNSSIFLTNTSIETAFTPAIGGTGTINLGSVTLLSDTSVAPTVTLSRKDMLTGNSRALTFDTDNATAGVTLSGTTLSADGTDANIDIDVTPKGAGNVKITNRTPNAVSTYGTGGALTEVGPLTDGQLVIGSTGGAPSAATLTPGSGISIGNAAGSVTITATAGGFAWTEVGGTSQAMAVDNGYIANNPALVTLTLPATATVGATVQIMGKGAGGWRIAQNAGQIIHYGNQSTTTGVGGRLDSTHRRDTVELVCVTANSDWTAMDGVGNLSVT